MKESRPARARGLKRDRINRGVKTDASRPARARGLKPLHPLQCGNQPHVAPRAGAWIETQIKSDSSCRRTVAPRAGAWIETSATPARRTGYLSRPARARGLKPRLPCPAGACPSRAPRGRVD